MQEVNIKFLKQHTIVPKKSGYYILEYEGYHRLYANCENEQLIRVVGTAKVYYRVDELLFCTEDSNNFKYFNQLLFEIAYCLDRRTYFSKIDMMKSVLLENEMAAIREYVVNGISESNGCTIISDKGAVVLINGKVEIPLTWKSINYNFKNPILVKLRKNNRSLSYIKDFHYITPMEEEFGVDFKNLGTFNFNCPVCTNENSPAGYLKMPRVFYNNNKEKIYNIIRYNWNTHFLINDPNYILPSNSTYTSYRRCFPETVFTEKLINKLNNFSHCDILIYGDYYNMFKDLYPNIEPVNIYDIKTSEQIKHLHDQINDIYKINESKLFSESYLKVKETFPKYEFSDEEFTIFYPEKPEDIVREGSKLHHCVGSYIKRIIRGNNIILFLRKNEELDKSLVTVDIIPINDGLFEIEQAHGKCNCCISEIPGVTEFIKKWANKFNIKINNLNKVR